MKKANPYFNPSKPHHTPSGFINKGLACYSATVEHPVVDEHVEHKQADVRLWQKQRKANKLPRPPKNGYKAFIDEWLTTINPAVQGDFVWWLGHASLMLKIDNNYFLFDPVLCERVSPVSFWGPKRLTPAPIKSEDLPIINTVFISHNHYDHLDKQTILAIYKKSKQTRFIVPLGLKEWFVKLGIHNVIELDWWDKYHLLDSIEITFTPAKHWSIRTIFDKNKTLWGGFAFKTKGLNFYFSGDSAFSESLFAIHDFLGPFNLVCLPIGAYEPRWFMQVAHMDPQNAVTLFKYFKYPKVIPIHWGVFELGDESLDDPISELSKALAEVEPLSIEKFTPLKIGGYLDLADYL